MSHLDSRTSFDAGDLDDGCCGATATACCANAKEDSINTPVSTPSGNPASLVEEETQGYDVEFDPPLESKYECPICLMALREAVQTPCGHRFCKGCIIKSIRDAGPKCPVDNEILQEKQLFPDNFAKREILSLTVKCPSQGCYVKMELRRLEAHLASCEFASLVCKQCQGYFQKNQLDEHMKMDCPKREILCENCALPMPFEQKQEHEESCPLAYVMCEYCQMNLIRQQIADHYNVDCVMAPISCTYNTFGCTEKMQRNDLARHLQEFTQAHMQMMAVTLFGVSNSLTPTTDLNSIFPYSGRFESRPPSVTPTHLSTIPSHHDCSQEYQNLRETIDQLETRLVRQDHQIRELIAKMETQSSSVAELKSTIRNLEDKIVEMEAHQSNGVFLWRIKNFSTLLKNQEEDKPVVIHSLGFYTGRPGYKLCLRLHIQLPSAQRCANYISLFIHTMQGDYDNLLPWPFQGTIRLSILDQSDSPAKVDQEEVMETKPDLLAFQRPTMQRNPKGFGYVTFMPLQNLKQRQYVKNDTLLVRCVVSTHLDLNSPRREGFQPRSTDCSMQPPV